LKPGAFIKLSGSITFNLYSPHRGERRVQGVAAQVAFERQNFETRFSLDRGSRVEVRRFPGYRSTGLNLFRV
jgi:hypothetical protein